MIHDCKTILLVEDSDEDYTATKRAFEKARCANPLIRVEDGLLALDYLLHRGKYQDVKKYPMPGVILLDLNLPGLDGRDVLKKIKVDEELKKIPIIVLTTSSDEKDINDCYRDGANSYIQKPVSVEGFVKAVQRLAHYWFEIVLLPKVGT